MIYRFYLEYSDEYLQHDRYVAAWTGISPNKYEDSEHLKVLVETPTTHIQVNFGSET
jgi:hypothetical protein